MRVRLNRKIMDLKSVWYENCLWLIDQRQLPEKLVFKGLRRETEVAEAINKMVVRGAPAIGVAGAYGVAMAAQKGREKQAAKIIKNARPTAVDLSNCVDKVMDEPDSKSMLAKAHEISNRVVSSCKRIGEFGEKLIKKDIGILTHCNAGALATVDWGTALAPLRIAQRKKKNPFVYVDETRPRLQGALTSWELLNEGIEHRVIVDNARGYFMRKGKIGLVIVGSDRVCVSDGSIANKIGTYEVAVMAKENRIPFYVAAPLTTFDAVSGEGNFKIEERDEGEVLDVKVGKRGFPVKARALNPAFDVTPKKYITGVICEKGIYRPGDLKRALRD